MQLRLPEVPEDGMVYTGEEPPELLAFSDPGAPRVLGPIRYALRAFNVPGALYAKGKLSVEVEFRCVRCGLAYRTEVEAPDFACARELTLGEHPQPVDDAEEIPENPLNRRHSDDTHDPECVDLTGDIREAMILALPSYPVCRPECRGLCPRCGVDLNREPCQCRPEPDARWDGLNALHLK